MKQHKGFSSDFFYVLDNTYTFTTITKQSQTSHAQKKKIKLLRNSSIEIKVEIVTNLLWPRLYKDKTN